MQNKPAIAQIIELLGKKRVMRIIWELRAAPLTFRQLQAACDNISPTLLNARIKELIDNNIVCKQPPKGYTLTAAGFELLEIYQPLKKWAIRWQSSLER